jgi:hypothetical protein
VAKQRSELPFHFCEACIFHHIISDLFKQPSLLFVARSDTHSRAAALKKET